MQNLCRDSLIDFTRFSFADRNGGNNRTQYVFGAVTCGGVKQERHESSARYSWALPR
jgi:hypothetical protein